MAQCYGRRRLAARACALVCLLAALYCSPALAASWTVEGRVVGVSDGDTITLLDDNKTQPRSASLESTPPRRASVRHVSKESLSRFVFDKRVEARCQKRDRYAREVCK